MSFFGRMRAAGSALFGKDSAVGGMIAMRVLGRPVWMAHNYRAYAREGYSENVIAYRCIRIISEAASNVPVLAYDGLNELSEHDLLDLFDTANPWQSGAELIDALVSYYLIAGDGFLEAVELDGRIRELYALRPDRMKAIPGRRGYPAQWKYSVDGGSSHTFDVDTRPGDQSPIWHLKAFNPLDDWSGLSPMGPAAKSIDTHNSASSYNKALLDNSASPSGALTVEVSDDSDGTLSDDQYDRLKQQLADRSSGPKNAGKPMILEGGLKWQAMGMTPKELEFVLGKREEARNISLAFGVPPMILGIPGDNTYSNYQEANRALYRETVLPLLGRILKGVSTWVQPTYPGVRLEPDIDQIPALSTEREAVWKRMQEADFVTTDEKREATGYKPYKPTEKPGGRIMVGGALTPLEDAGFEPGGAEPDVDEDGNPIPPVAPPAK